MHRTTFDYSDRLCLTVLYFFLFIATCFGEDNIPITPTPKQIVFKNYNITITSDWRITIDKYDNENSVSINYLNQQLLAKNAFMLPIEKTTSLTGQKHIILGTINDNLIEEILSKEKVDISELASDEGYILEIFENDIVIVANKPAGVFYGIQTFLQLIKIKDSGIIVPAVKIIDYPSIEKRGVHFCGANLSKMKEYIDQMARLKLNVAIIETWDYFSLNEGNKRQMLEGIFAYARERNIEPAPELASFGAGGAVLKKDPYAAEGIWVEDELFKFVNGKATPVKPTKHSLVNVIRSEDSNIIIKTLDKTKTYTENVDYKIIEGAISYPYSPDNYPTKILRVPNGKIGDGEEVLISYDYVERKCSYAESSIPYCPSTERTYKIMFKALEDVIRTLKPNYISISHDEIRGMNRDSRCKIRNLSNAELLADEINRLNDFVKIIDPSIKLLMWDDMIDPWHNGNNEKYQAQFGGALGKTSPALDIIPKDVIMMVWWYDPDDWLNKMKNGLDYFESKGFGYFVSCWKNKKNIDDWERLIEGRESCLGIIVTTWDGFDKNLEGITYTAQTAW